MALQRARAARKKLLNVGRNKLEGAILSASNFAWKLLKLLSSVGTVLRAPRSEIAEVKRVGSTPSTGSTVKAWANLPSWVWTYLGRSLLFG